MTDDKVFKASYSLQALSNCADEACLSASMDKAQFEHEAINWADLRCVEAEYYYSTDGQGHRVLIEECSPYAVEFAAFITKYLSDNGFVGIEVNTEW